MTQPQPCRTEYPRCNICLTQVAADHDTGKCLTCQQRDPDEHMRWGDDMTDWLQERIDQISR
jgi:hypothetical protein